MCAGFLGVCYVFLEARRLIGIAFLPALPHPFRGLQRLLVIYVAAVCIAVDE